MNRAKLLTQFVAGSTAAVAVVVAQQAAGWADARQLPAWVPPTVAVVVVVVLVQVLRAILELVLDSSKGLRRLFLGRQFVEGTWLDLLKTGTEPIGYGFSRIEYTSSSLRFAGEDFLLDGTAQGHYTADLVDFEWPTIRYKYTYQSSASSELSRQGYGEAQFVERDGPPTHYVGFYFDLVDGRRVSYEGWRITDAVLLSQLDDVNNRRDTIVRFFAKHLEYSRPTG